MKMQLQFSNNYLVCIKTDWFIFHSLDGVESIKIIFRSHLALKAARVALH